MLRGKDNRWWDLIDMDFPGVTYRDESGLTLFDGRANVELNGQLFAWRGKQWIRNSGFSWKSIAHSREKWMDRVCNV